MKILATQKFLDTLEYAQEQKKRHQGEMRVLLWKLYRAIPEELQTEEVVQAYNTLVHEFDGHHTNPYDSFRNCIFRILRWELNSQLQNPDNHYVIGSEHGEYCLRFAEHRADGGCGLCGGIIYHGFPDTGYTTNGSIQLDKSYGWSTHT